MCDIFYFCTSLISFANVIRANDGALQLVHVLFRHGDRTNRKVDVYPKDPYKEETYYAYGYGQLTNKGKQKEYQLGEYLRKIYGDFLGNTYTNGIVYARSTQTDRTINSLQLVLAGLFPPRGKLVWNENLLWQPIPFIYNKREEDLVLQGTHNEKFRELYREHIRSRPPLYELHKNFLDHLEEMTGWKMRDYETIEQLHSCLKTEKEWGFKLPKWAKMVWKNITKLVIEGYYVGNANNRLKLYTCGYFLKKIIEDTASKQNGAKIFLYSAHDDNISNILICLGVFLPHTPPYGAFITFEVHNTTNEGNGLTISYQDYTCDEPKILKIPGCATTCPLNKFVEIHKQMLPCGTPD